MTPTALDTPTEVASAATPRVRVPIHGAVVGATVLGTAAPVLLFGLGRGTLSVHFVAVAFFFWLNAIIAFFEIALFRHVDAVREDYEQTRDAYRGRELARVKAFFGQRIPLRELLATRHWSGIWSTYALFDDAYADKRSFGFFIDVGNGFSTLIPSLLIPYAIVFEWLPARVLGLVMLIASYQMLYGTLVYFASFILGRRYRGHTAANLAVFVGLSNGIWTVFPVWSIVLALFMIETNDYGVFGG